VIEVPFSLIVERVGVALEVDEFISGSLVVDRTEGGDVCSLSP
jgi:hypothetical protein